MTRKTRESDEIELFSDAWWKKVNCKKLNVRDELDLDRKYGPRYPALPSLEKWRKLDKQRDLTDEEGRAYGRSVGEAIRALQWKELCGARNPEVSMRCTVQNTCGTDNTAAGEEARYRLWVDVTLPMMRLVREMFPRHRGNSSRGRKITRKAA